MNRALLFLAGIGFLAAAIGGLSPVRAVPGGQIGTLPTGRYICELPGDIEGEVRLRLPAHDFEVITASTYVANHGRGTYLLTGDRVVMTGGPLRGRKFHRVSFGYLRLMSEDEADDALRCVLSIGR